MWLGYNPYHMGRNNSPLGFLKSSKKSSLENRRQEKFYSTLDDKLFSNFYFLVSGFFYTSDFRGYFLNLQKNVEHDNRRQENFYSTLDDKLFLTFYFLVAGFFSTSDYCDRHFLE